MNVPNSPATDETSAWSERPVLGAVLLVIAGVIVAYVTVGYTRPLLGIGGPFTGIGLWFGLLLCLTGIIALFRPHRSTILGILGVAFSILSVVGSLGGLLVGLLIGIAGGNMLIAWHPPDPRGDSRGPNTPPGPDTSERTKPVTASGFSWEEGMPDMADGGEVSHRKRPVQETLNRQGMATGDAPVVRPDTGGTDRQEQHLDDALERVAHGATVSFPSLIFKKGVGFAITGTLTNGFAASSYGLYVLARQLIGYLEESMFGFLPGLNRFLPNSTDEEQDVLATLTSLLMLGIGTAFGAVVFLAAPHISRIFDHGPQFEIYIRVFAIGLPGTLWFQTVNKLLESLEEVEARNLMLRFGFPVAELAVVAIGTILFGDLVAVSIGIVLVTILTSLALTGWLMWQRGFTPRARAAAVARLGRKYLRYTSPLVAQNVVRNVQSSGFYLLIIIFSSSIAAGLLAVGTLVGSLVRLPLVLNNQFMAPVVSDLHTSGHDDALQRLYQVTSRMILVGITGVVIPLFVFREAVMSLFGPTFVEYSALLPGFLLAKFISSAAGSNGIVLRMVDRQRAELLIDVATTVLLVVTAIPLIVHFGLPGMVVGYLLEAIISNGLQVGALYYLEGYHPFTRLYAEPLVAAVPYIVIAYTGKLVLSDGVAPFVGTLAGLVAYATALHAMGFTATERRLVASLLSRYREAFPISRRIMDIL